MVRTEATPDTAVFSTLCDMLFGTPQSPSGADPAVSDAVDVGQLFDLARHHGVDGVLHDLFLAREIQIPEPLQRRLREVEFLRSIQHQRSLETTTAIIEALNASGICAVPLKGSVLAHRIYPKPSSRPSVDIDVVVDVRELDAALVVLAEHGFHCRESSPRVQAKRTRGYDVTCVSDSANAVLELHFHAIRTNGGVLPAKELLERALPYMVQGQRRIRVLAAEDEFLYLAVHSAKHFDVNLRLLLDLRLFLGEYSGLDWAVVASRARSTRTARSLALTLRDLAALGVGGLSDRETRPIEGLRAALIDRMRLTRSCPNTPRHLAIMCSLAAGSLLADTSSGAVSVIIEGTVRIARRWAYHRTGGLAPESWEV